MSADRSPIMPPEPNRLAQPIFGDTEACVLSSGALGWKGIRVEEYHYSALEVPEMEMSVHVVDVQLSPDLDVAWYLGGRYQTKRMVTGDICLFPTGPHTRVRWQEQMNALIIALDPSHVAQVAYESVPPRGVELVTRYGGADPQIQHIGMALKAEIENGGPCGPLYGESLGTALAAHLLHHYNAFAPVSGAQGATRSAGGLSPTDLRRVLALIHDQLDVNLSLAEMAQTVNVSPFHFSRLFRQSTGFAPHQYVIAQRVEAARCLLMRGGLAAGQIAGRVGFASQSHLNRHFKRIYGVPPAAFARTNAFDPARHFESKNVQTDDNRVEDDLDPAAA